MPLFTPRDRIIVQMTLLAALTTLILGVLWDTPLTQDVYRCLMPMSLLLFHMLAFDQTFRTKNDNDAIVNGALATLGSLYVLTIGEGLIFTGTTFASLAFYMSVMFAVVAAIYQTLLLLAKLTGGASTHD